jgi:hypothetical protein
MREDTQIVITLGYATSTHYLTIERQTIVGLRVVWSEMLFSFWQHPFYKRGGVGPIPKES